MAKLNANEMNYGPHPNVDAAKEAAEKFHVYPDPNQAAMRAAIAETHPPFEAKHIVAGAGSDDCLDILIRVIRPNHAIIPVPTLGCTRPSVICTVFQHLRFHDLERRRTLR